MSRMRFVGASPDVASRTTNTDAPSNNEAHPSSRLAATPEAAGRSSERVREKTPRAKVKANPALIAKARELRDKWMDHVATNGGEPTLLTHHAKYDACRLLAGGDLVAAAS